MAKNNKTEMEVLAKTDFSLSNRADERTREQRPSEKPNTTNQKSARSMQAGRKGWRKRESPRRCCGCEMSVFGQGNAADTQAEVLQEDWVEPLSGWPLSGAH